MMMKKIMTGLFLFAFLPSVALAQSGDKRAWGYVFGGVGGASDGEGAFAHVGGGGEGLIHKGFGLGAELGYFAPISENFGDGVGILSVNPAYHFNRSQKAQPFVTGGFSLAFRGGGASGGGNVGGGVQYWFKEKAALRVEYRTHVFSSDRPFTHSLRVGISFR
jgi:hypothetical protein